MGSGFVVSGAEDPQGKGRGKFTACEHFPGGQGTDQAFAFPGEEMAGIPEGGFDLPWQLVIVQGRG